MKILCNYKCQHVTVLKTRQRLAMILEPQEFSHYMGHSLFVQFFNKFCPVDCYNIFWSGTSLIQINSINSAVFNSNPVFIFQVKSGLKLEMN